MNLKMTLCALINKPSPLLANCELVFLEHQEINFDLALKQHEGYCKAFQKCGVEVEVLNANPNSPDSVFVEDCAVVLDEIAVIASMGTSSRSLETSSIEYVLSRHRKIAKIMTPAKLEGGDVLRIDRKLFAGLSSRTNLAGIQALSQIVTPVEYEVIPVQVNGCLHLKTGVTALDNDTVLINRGWIAITPFENFHVIDVSEREPFAANALPIEDNILMNAASLRTIDKVQSLGYDVTPVAISEFAKAEAGLTCMSLIFKNSQPD
jgi:dimethylargininase